MSPVCTPVTTAGVRRLLTTHPMLRSLHTDVTFPGGGLIRLALDRGDRPLKVEATGARAESTTGADGHTLKVDPPDVFATVHHWRAGWRVDHLWLEHTDFTGDTFAHMLDFVALGRIRRLTLWKCKLRNADAVALAARLPELAITHLDLSENKIGLAGAKALANSPGLASVVSLGLRANPILKSGRAALAASPHKTALKEINLHGHRERVDAAEVRELRKAFGKGVKVMIRA